MSLLPLLFSLCFLPLSPFKTFPFLSLSLSFCLLLSRFLKRNSPHFPRNYLVFPESFFSPVTEGFFIIFYIKENMIGPTNFIDEIDCGSFFDHIDDLLDFPNEDVEAGLSASDSAVNASAFPSIWTTHSESLPGSDSVFSNNSASDLSAELSVPYEDIVQLEWLSNFVDDSQCGASLTIKKEESSSITKDSSQHQFQTSSPVSVLESSSSCSGEKTLPRSPETAAPGRRGRARSKRPRPTTFNPRPAIQLISPTSSVNENDIPQPFVVPKVPSDSENYAESRLLIKIPRQVNPEHKKKKKIKLSLPTAPADNNQNSSGQAVRKCMHCEITKTPQWRAGPMGPKTLCNACGVRYKSGRLFPEYRPAASPTFVPSLHSNSHKKVIEMRNKGGAAPTTMVTSSPELIPNKSNPALDFM
ncbi:Plant-specific GATA-type zinc finger transcription factor family protein isoform 1 [Theobroma cacao]|uniref:Plant-specific GATA-type zinc finger transcription factor family protein isoform 1 n=2 Tax=Theobroma cacao TaxID=3641 RepID=A0A061FP83_THECC|nr:Plant-specific GATA-type zinc finger transcription factor family protein isoform 1 [Theobroma cacao]